MASLIQRNGKFLARIRITGKPSISETFNDKRSAQAWAVQTEDQIRRGVYEFNRQAMPTLRQALDDYLKKITPRKKGAKIERYVIGKLQLLPVAAKPIDQIQSAEFARLRDAWAKEISPSTIQKRHALLSHLYSVANREWGYDVVNPLLRVSKLKVDNQRTRTVAPDELDAILAAAPNNTIRTIARLAWHCAARLGELVSLDWQYVNLPARVMEFPITKNGSARTVPLTPSAAALLESLNPQTSSAPVFGVTSQAMSKAWIAAVHKARRAYEQGCDAQGVAPDADWLSDVHFHDLRHSAITRLAEHGLSTLELASISALSLP